MLQLYERGCVCSQYEGQKIAKLSTCKNYHTLIVQPCNLVCMLQATPLWHKQGLKRV